MIDSPWKKKKYKSYCYSNLIQCKYVQIDGRKLNNNVIEEAIKKQIVYFNFLIKISQWNELS